MPSPRKLWVIGLDGATFDLLRPWVNAGYLPTLARLMQQGAWGELASTIHPLSPAAWSTFITGLNPGKHGIFDFTRRRPGSYELELTNAGLRAGRSLWRILSEAGHRVGVINVPMTFPPEPVCGYLVSGLDTPSLDSGYTYPASLAQELRGKHVISVSTIGKSLEQYVEELLDTVERRFHIMHHLLTREPTDFFMSVIMETDAVQHACWHLLPTATNGILQVYQQVDRRLGELLTDMPDDVLLMVMSDHGAGPIEKVVDLDVWLAEQGLLYFRSRSDHRQMARRLGRWSMEMAQRYLPRRAKELWKGAASKERVESFLLYADIDWARTQAFSIGNQGNICINLQGREPQGIVRPSDYEALRDKIAEQLRALHDPDTGERVVAQVYRREELYHGEHVARAPDLLIRWTEDKYLAKKDLTTGERRIFSKDLKFGRLHSDIALDQTGTHKLHGILMLYGEGVRPGAHIEGARLVDLAPTILYLMGEAIPTEMDGRVLLEPFEESFCRHYPVRYDTTAHDTGGQGSGYSAGDDALVRERLRGLGYVA